jgi:hypothetical protein
MNWLGFWRGRDDKELKDFGREMARGRLVRRYPRGLCTVPVARIVGSVSKAASMNRRFRYKSGKVDERLRRLREANRWGVCVLPPVELYQLNDEYYVVDGHHRLAIALESRQIDIDAHVTMHEVIFPAEPAVTTVEVGGETVAAGVH